MFYQYKKEYLKLFFYKFATQKTQNNTKFYKNQPP